MSEHIRIELLDPRGREQKRRTENQARPSNLSMDVSDNLKSLARSRTDIFEGDELAAKKRRETKLKDDSSKITWDGHSTSVGSVTQKVASAAASSAASAVYSMPARPAVPYPGASFQVQYPASSQYATPYQPQMWQGPQATYYPTLPPDRRTTTTTQAPAPAAANTL
ncbi:hypothetical protein BDK51DRAFT_34738 [Blyttiomyces helicus]|uniref:Splicing factor 3A subunit 1 conserved domain-containing protein n=1 Tax=Blyttiomyces helicus TaxID=388810 RepID=A0A4P9WKV8_9FUNG|nr:hypothetical protein BDK51DRAFT_34738 [Blyttiomyces helicus]|eukprot:RKO93032.1 hypothetical protein BDK51DRAFT_34738 [Blyttiomyces helicus]